MAITLETGIPFTEENEVNGDTALLYDEIKSSYQSPAVPNMFKAVAVSLPALTVQWTISKAMMSHLTLPSALVSMIMYTIAERNECKYCSAQHELSCRTLGIDEETLAALIKDLGSVTPERIRAIIEFALKVAKHPKSLVAADYEKLRQHGVTDSEIVEIILVAGAGVFGDTMADALKVNVEDTVANALAR